MKQYKLLLEMTNDNEDVLYTRTFVYCTGDEERIQGLRDILIGEVRSVFNIITKDLRDNPKSGGQLCFGHFRVANSVKCMDLLEKYASSGIEATKQFEVESDVDFSTNYKMLFTLSGVLDYSFIDTEPKKSVNRLIKFFGRLFGVKSCI